MMLKTGPNPPEFISKKRTVLIIAPILPGKAEAWRRFIQEMGGSHRREYESSRRHLGIRAERVWISETRRRTTGIMMIEANHLEQTLNTLANSDYAFDRWFREQLLALQGFDLIHPNSDCLPDLVFTWQGDDA